MHFDLMVGTNDKQQDLTNKQRELIRNGYNTDKSKVMVTINGNLVVTIDLNEDRKVDRKVPSKSH